MKNLSKFFWIIYFVLYLILFVLTSGFLLKNGQEFSGMSMFVDVLALFGLYRFACTDTVGSSFAWAIVAVLFSGRLLIVWYLLIPAVSPWMSLPEQKVALAGLLGSVCQMPGAIALWLYNFRQPKTV